MKFEDIKLWQFIIDKGLGKVFLPTSIENSLVRGIKWDVDRFWTCDTTWISSGAKQSISHSAASYEPLIYIERILSNRRDMIFSIFDL